MKEIINVAPLPMQQREMGENGKRVSGGGRDTVVAGATRCVNLTRDEATGALVAVTPPVVAMAGKPMPFEMVSHPTAGRIALYQSQNRLRARYLDRGTANDIDVGQLPGAVTASVATAPDRVEVMTDGGARRMSISDDGVCSLDDPRRLYPQLRFETVDEASLHADGFVVRLDGAYNSHSTWLDATDSRKITREMLGAYEGVCRSALAAGYLPQPVMVRYRLEGPRGELLYRSAPIFVSASDGFQHGGEMTFEINSEGCAGGLRLNCYKLSIKSVESASATDDAAVDRLVVEATLPIHPVDFSGQVTSRIVSTGTNSVGAHVTLPRLASLRGVVEALLSHEGSFRDVAVIKRPFASSTPIEHRIATDKFAAMAASEQAEWQRRLSAASPREVDTLARSCSVPHSFTARAGGLVGDMVVWGDVESRRFDGYPLSQLAVAVGDGEAWQSSVTVEMADGESRSAAVAWGDNHAPRLISPLLYYPSADAVAMTIAMRRGGRCYSHTYKLTPLPDASGAYYLADDFMPMELTVEAESFAYGVSANTLARHRGAVIIAKAADPLTPVDAVSVDDAVTAIAASPRRGSSWDYSRRRLYIFTRSGLKLAILDAKGRMAEVHPLDSRPVSSAALITPTTDDRYPLICVAGNDLVALSRGTVKNLRHGVAATAIGWDSLAGALWVAGVAGMTTVYREPGGESYRFAHFNVASLKTFGDTLLVSDGRDIRDTRADRPIEPVDVSYEITLRLPSRLTTQPSRRLAAQRPVSLSLGLEGSLATATLTLSADGRVFEQISLTPRRDVGPALTLSLLSPPARRLTVALTGRFYPLTRLTSLSATTVGQN